MRIGICFPRMWPVAYATLLLGAVFFSYGLVRGSPDEDPRCQNNICENSYFFYKCAPNPYGIAYLFEDCQKCADTSGRCIERSDSQIPPSACAASEITNQFVAVTDTTPQCDCAQGTGYVEASGS